MIPSADTVAVSKPSRGLLHSPAFALWLLIAVTTAFRIIAASILGIGNGEGYYFSSLKNLQLSYFDQPPMFAWLGWLGMTLCGSTDVFFLRLPFILLSIGSTFLMFDFARHVVSQRAALFAAVLMNFAAVFLVPVGSWLQPDGPLIFFWLASCCCLVRLLAVEHQSHAWRWWLLFGLSLGLTGLSKYHAAFLGVGVLFFLLTTRRHWHWLKHLGPWLAGGLALLLTLPVFIWNAQHDFISFTWQSGRGAPTQLRWDWLLQSLIGQALWLLPWLWVALVAALGWVLWRGLMTRNQATPLNDKDAESGEHDQSHEARLSHDWLQRERWWFLACTAFLPIIFFTVVAIWASLGFHFHWQAPGYLMLFPVVGYWLNQRWQASRVQRIAAVTFLAATILVSTMGWVLLISHARLGWLDPVIRAVAGREVDLSEEPTLETMPFTPLRETLKNESLFENDEVFVVTNRWFLAGRIDHALQGRKTVLNFHPDSRNLAFIESSRDWIGRDAIAASVDPFAQGWAEDKQHGLEAYFRSVEPMSPVELKRGGRVVMTVYRWRCQELLKPYEAEYGLDAVE